MESDRWSAAAPSLLYARALFGRVGCVAGVFFLIIERELGILSSSHYILTLGADSIMVNLNELRADDLAKILTLRRKIEILEREMAKILKTAQKREPALSVSVRNMRVPRAAQPSLRDLVSEILRKAKEPMSVQEIYAASLDAGYQWRSQEPTNALNVKMYTDRTFKKVAPGQFVMRK